MVKENAWVPVWSIIPIIAEACLSVAVRIKVVVTLDVRTERPDGTALNFATVTVMQQVNQFLMQRNYVIQRLYPYD